MSHGMSRTKFYRVWLNMKYRCYNPKNENYKYYGGKGIYVCERWHVFENFYEDMYPTYQEGLSIDRINSDGNYEPSNCRWSDIITQNNNKSDNIRICFRGHTRTLVEWSRELKIDYNVLYERYKENERGTVLFRPTRKPSSKKRGVSFRGDKKKKWAVNIQLNGKTKYLGSYETEELAHDVFLKAHREYRGLV